ncbi:hypothetical protein NQ176_g7453 [Zarea fungicola]|uniref:Uncharacterized protein n=1 Tax=Zarea fungicola TaxID=93591 RepID=A0ACC1N0E2_9HYPO|nr:hypothetical protein NQ176_g7453 [Lecanicillium fungicola]
MQAQQAQEISWDPFPWKYFPGYTQSQRCASISSWIRQFGYDIEKSDDDTKRRWVCRVCVDRGGRKPHSTASNGTQNAEIRLWTDHSIWDPYGRRKPPSNAKESTPSRNIAEMMKLNTYDSREQQIPYQIIGRFDRLTFQRLVVCWIINSNSSFRQSEDLYLRAVFEYLNPLVKTTEAHLTHDTVRRRILTVYEENKEEIKRVLAAAPGLIHIAFDGWRSNNRHALYGVVCYFLDATGQPQKLVLGLPELVDRHSGENIATHIVDILESYDITSKVGYFTLDNASNDTAMREIGRALGFDGETRRLRCFGHILNLAVKALLFGHDSEAFEDDLLGGEALNAKAHELWRRKGPVGKLHNLIVWIHRSDLLTNLLRSLQLTAIERSEDPAVRAKKPLDVITNVATHFLEELWYRQKNEWEGMMLRGKKQRKDMPLCLRDNNKLDEKDWKIIALFNEVLQHFEHVIITLEGDGRRRMRKNGDTKAYGCSWDLMFGYEYLLHKMEAYKAAAHRYPDPEHFKVNVNLCWKKLEEYYSRLDETPAYYAAVALHPAYRWGYFEDIWADRPEWIQNAKSLVEGLYRSQYEPRAGYRDREPATKKQRTYRNPFNEYCAESRQVPALVQSPLTPASSAVGDEYNDWFRDVHKSDEKVLDPISYWCERREEYPRLSRMALDVLSTLPMSADVERLFSTSGRMVRDDRANLDASTIGMTQTVRSWLRGGYIRSVEKLLEEVELPDPDPLAKLSFMEARELTGGRIVCTTPL